MCFNWNLKTRTFINVYENKRVYLNNSFYLDEAFLTWKKFNFLMYDLQ